jgi:hypothetical protein
VIREEVLVVLLVVLAEVLFALETLRRGWVWGGPTTDLAVFWERGVDPIQVLLQEAEAIELAVHQVVILL